MQGVTNDHITLHRLEHIPQASTSDHKPVRAVLSARLFSKIKMDGRLRTQPLPQDTAGAIPARRGSLGAPPGGRFSEESVRTAVVRFTRMQARGLKAADLNGLSDPYLQFHAVPFTDYLLRTDLQSKVKKKTLDAEWKGSEVPELPTILRNNAELRHLVIVVSVWDHDVSSEDDPLGDVIIPIGSFVDPNADPNECTDVPPQKFNKRLTLHGQQIHKDKDLGYLTGAVSVTWQWDAHVAEEGNTEECSIQ